MDFLCDVDALPVRQPAVDRRSRGWSQRRVERVDVKAQVDRPLFPISDGGKSLIITKKVTPLNDVRP